MATVSELLTANLHDVFGNRDALEQKAAELLERVPGAFQFVEEGRRYASDTHGALAWGFGPVGAPVVRGIDVVEVRDGVVVALTTFFAEPSGD